MKDIIYHLYVAFLILIIMAVNLSNGDYLIDPGKQGRRYDGIGALSAGGGSAKLLIGYPEKYRNQILDYLFKPNFGASLQILKCEIGGDADSTIGTESSHMHEESQENYHTGYEWWLMTEAKKRNPNITLYGLPWAFPGWVGQQDNPYAYPDRMAKYVTKWVWGASKYHNLDINYVGIWNEKSYNMTYVETLRKSLDNAGFGKVKIVVADDHGWAVADDIFRNENFAKVVDVIGVHYPENTTVNALKTGKTLWASEEFSTYNDDHGAGCLARTLNQNYVRSYLTSSIMWNILSSFYEALLYSGYSIMTANQPWSGHYTVNGPVWTTAHTTQFVQKGWKYLSHEAGVGFLKEGGSYVSLVSPDREDFTLIIETMNPNDTLCFVTNPSPTYTVKPQSATFTIRGPRKYSLTMWSTKLSFDGQPSSYFKRQEPIKIENGQFTLFLDVNSVYTLSTVQTASKGHYPDSPQNRPFPLPHNETFYKYSEYSEAAYFTSSVVVWEVRKEGPDSHQKVYRQVVTEKPLNWISVGDVPVSLIGNISWANISIQSDIRIPSSKGSSGAFLALRFNTKGGIMLKKTDPGIFFRVIPSNNTYIVANNFGMTQILSSGKLPKAWKYNKWTNLLLSATGLKENSLQGFMDNLSVFQVMLSGIYNTGFAAIGTVDYGIVDFDNIVIKQYNG